MLRTGLILLATLGGFAQARAALPDNFEDQLVVSGLNQPASLAFLPDGRVLVVEQNTAEVELVVGGSLTTVHTISDVNTSGNERGLLGIAVDPRWPTPPYVYFYFDRTPGPAIYISRFTGMGDLDDGGSSTLSLGCRYDILVDIPDNASNHNGGTIRFGPDNMLYASLGEDANPCAAQDSSDFRGVILRLDVLGLPGSGGGPPSKSQITPSDNPFPSTDPEAGLTFCFGLRNPFRFNIDPVTGRVYIGDVGQRNFEEMDEASGGENFGWPFREGPEVRTLAGCSEPGGSGASTYDAPIGYYDRRSFSPASIIGGPRYRPVSGGAYTFPALYDGVVFYSEYYEGFIRVLTNSGGVWAPLAPVPGQPNPDDWATGITNVGDFLQGPDGAGYYLKQFPGELRRIVYNGTVTGVPDGWNFTVPRLTVQPNPFRAGSGSMRVEAGGQGRGSIEVFSIAGKRVRTLFAGSLGGQRTVTWDGRDESGGRVAAGVYFVHLVTPAGSTAQRVVVLR